MLINFRKLFTANVIVGILGLVSLTLVSRELGAAAFGIFAVAVSISAFVEQLSGFQAWQAVTKFATEEREKNDPKRFWKIVGLGVALDFIGCFLAALLGYFGVLVFASTLGIPQQSSAAVAFYMLALVFAFSGTPMAVLRIYEKYDTIGWVLVSVSALKLLLLSIFFSSGLTTNAALAIYAGTMMLQHLTFVYLLARIARRDQRLLKLSDLRWSDFKKFPGLLRFVGSVYLSATVRHISQELDTLILSAASGPAIAGQYRLAKQYGSVILRVIEPAQQVLYPRVARLVTLGQFDTLAALSKKVVWLGVGFSLILIAAYYFVGSHIVSIAVGEEYNRVPMFLGLYLVALSIFCCLFVLRPLVLSFGKPDAILLIYVVATVTFLLSYYFLRELLGPAAMMIGQIAFYSVWAVGMVITVYVCWRSKIRDATAASDLDSDALKGP
ncbi:O-antigen/teichoic acid export membrane protein [Loktanella sp. PT4BL]|jgi:O-antigen/teichoic acid export membrane protein|uniref:lipopolysaccharide biosynthesis protein n=1 Tax=Loktanella sp. PT4BL TaxID=2135611 RepID=UPI000D7685B6|nr:lipopolysaccharide biosynthesis protein [Loktanella sp. PT4BL]PXW66161.1 O-antigen/teichoic acid export membrane protein [Loktanella sp. PT4BL]